MSAVTGIDERNRCVFCRYNRCTFLRMPHGNDIRIVGNGFNRIGYAFSLGCRRTRCPCETEDGTAELQHSRLKGKSGSCRRFKKQSRQLLMFASLPVVFGLCFNLIRQSHQLINFLNTQIQNVNDTTIFLHPFTLSYAQTSSIENPFSGFALMHYSCPTNTNFSFTRNSSVFRLYFAIQDSSEGLSLKCRSFASSSFSI